MKCQPYILIRQVQSLIHGWCLFNSQRCPWEVLVMEKIVWGRLLTLVWSLYFRTISDEFSCTLQSNLFSERVLIWQIWAPHEKRFFKPYFNDNLHYGLLDPFVVSCVCGRLISLLRVLRWVYLSRGWSCLSRGEQSLSYPEQASSQLAYHIVKHALGARL